MSVKIIVDSAADLTPAAKKGVAYVVPMSIIFGDTEYQDGVTLTSEQFYEKLAAGDCLPTTSQPTPAAFEEVYREATADGSEVVMITISSRLSGTYQSATIAAEDFPGVYVVDSRNAALGEGILAEHALTLAEQGKNGAEILEILMEQRKRIRLYAIVDTLEYLKKGGRISPTVAFVGGMLNVKPMICVEDGEIKTLGTSRGMKKAYAQLNAECGKFGGVDSTMPVLLGYTGTDDSQLRSYVEVSGDLWQPETPAAMVCATIGVHTGPGVVAAGFFSKE